MAERTPRDLDTRARSERPKQWMLPELLPSPHPEEGFEFRWIRISTLGQVDPTNVTSKLREGWEPVKASEHPEIMHMGGSNQRFPDSIEVGGLMLCKTPKEFVQQRNSFFQQKADGQMQSVDNSFMRENDRRMPLFNERRSEVKFGRGAAN
jgi:hypothetical protein